MVDEPDNLVLVQLREMRAEFRDVRAEIREVRSSVSDLTLQVQQQGKRLDDVLEAAVLASGYANLAVHKFDLMEQRVGRLEGLEGRVTKLEQAADT